MVVPDALHLFVPETLAAHAALLETNVFGEAEEHVVGYQFILKSFIRLEFDSVGPPDLPEGWELEVVILAANGD